MSTSIFNRLLLNNGITALNQPNISNINNISNFHSPAPDASGNTYQFILGSITPNNNLYPGNALISGNVVIDPTNKKDISGNSTNSDLTLVSGNINLLGNNILPNISINGNDGNILLNKYSSIPYVGNISNLLPSLSGNNGMNGLYPFYSNDYSALAYNNTATKSYVNAVVLDVYNNILNGASYGYQNLYEISEYLQNINLSGGYTEFPVFGGVDISGYLNVDGPVVFSGSVNFNNPIDISGNIYVNGNIDISGNLNIEGNIDISGNIDIEGNLEVNNIDISGNLDVNNIYGCRGYIFHVYNKRLFTEHIKSKDIKVEDVEAKNIETKDIKVKDVEAKNIKVDKITLGNNILIESCGKNINIKYSNDNGETWCNLNYINYVIGFMIFFFIVLLILTYLSILTSVALFIISLLLLLGFIGICILHYNRLSPILLI